MKKCSDFIIVITWPYGLVKGANSWYDYFLSNNKSYNFVENIHQIWLLAITDLEIGKREYSAK